MLLADQGLAPAGPMRECGVELNRYAVAFKIHFLNSQAFSYIIYIQARIDSPLINWK
jgi:hypothetical protein